MGVVSNAGAATGALGGAPYGATKRCPGWRITRNPAYERGRWGLGWGSLWGHEACDGCADMGGKRANLATRPFNGATCGAMKRLRDVPKLVEEGMRAQPLWPSVELSLGPRSVSGVC